MGWQHGEKVNRRTLRLLLGISGQIGSVTVFIGGKQLTGHAGRTLRLLLFRQLLAADRINIAAHGWVMSLSHGSGRKHFSD